MAAPSPILMRCPACGGELRVVLAPQPATQWFPCPHCRAPVPVVVPRDPPPLYSWEVLPGLYPALPRPRLPRWRAHRAAAIALFLVVALSAGFAAVLVYDAYLATAPAPFVVAGSVEHYQGNALVPVPGATVVLTNDANRSTSETTGLDGSFSFASVPPGGVTVNVSAAGYAPVSVTTFVSSVYSPSSGGIAVVLSPGGTANATTIALAPFPDLEQFVASLGSGAVLLGIVTLVAGTAGIATWRDDRPALGVVGGAAGLLSPLVLFYLSLTSAFPLLEAGSALVAGAGAFALLLRTVQVAQTTPPAA
jgi:Carboxypeptidase regulatory-like domain